MIIFFEGGNNLQIFKSNVNIMQIKHSNYKKTSLNCRNRTNNMRPINRDIDINDFGFNKSKLSTFTKILRLDM